MFRISEVVKNLIIINVIVFFAVKYLIPIPGFDRYFSLITPGLEYEIGGIIYKFEPVQLVTHMFMHGDETHLFFNMISLLIFGPLVELSLGPKRFLLMYLSCGFFASFAQLLITQGAVLGASGATYGISTAFATMFPNMQMMLLFPPIPIKAKYLAIGSILVALYYGIGGGQSGIAHFAHIGGALLGFILVKYWKMDNLR